MQDEPRGALSVAFETNGRGFIGFIVELFGAFVRGRTEEEALSKVPSETQSYLRWAGGVMSEYKIVIVQRHRSGLTVEDADNEILLDADRRPITLQEFEGLTALVRYSGSCFSQLYDRAELKDWIDSARIRKTFYGENPRSIREIFNHVRQTQYYYLSRTKSTFDDRETDFMKIREFCVAQFAKTIATGNSAVIYELDNELWTLRKILRRFIWHDRIHGKAIVRILNKQQRLGLIRRFHDPYHFGPFEA
jgi:hypothetical protein